MRKGASRAEPARNKRILKANPVCHICGQAIDLTVRWPDPMSGVFDHVLAVARGGTDQLSDLAAAHNHCNLDKGDRAHAAAIIRRSGALR
jgi:5-methylcytosine-specific restriction endonuclease McrA